MSNYNKNVQSSLSESHFSFYDRCLLFVLCRQHLSLLEWSCWKCWSVGCKLEVLSSKSMMVLHHSQQEWCPDYLSKFTQSLAKLIVDLTEPIPNDTLLYFLEVASKILSALLRLFVKSLEVYYYIYVWNNFRIFELPWDSAWTWWIAFLGVDFGYYWVHRCSHGRLSHKKLNGV